MYQYNFNQWLLIFYIYCFLGWILESFIVSLESKKLVNRGFLKSPLLPIYGFGAVSILFVTLPFKNSIIKIYIYGMISATFLEYISGTIMECLFKMKYWDYSNDKFNFKGKICLESSLFWGVLSIILIKFIHRYVDIIIYFINSRLINAFTLIITCTTLIDFIISLKEALDIYRVLKKISDIKEQIDTVYRDINMFIDKELECTFSVASASKIQSSDLFSKTKDKFNILNEKLKNLKSLQQTEISKISRVKTRLIKNNPTASSFQFNDTLKELRERFSNHYIDSRNEAAKKISDFQDKINSFIKKK